ncbi:MAG: radical SAM protein [Thaumarchaeota archaeon]|nr:radical SAM protein [Nitrososphaerota archaeon]
MNSNRFVLSADPSVMSHYRNNLLFGYFAGVPVGKLSPYIYEKIFCPTVKFDKNSGEALFAPLGLRRIESALKNSFGKKDVFVSHPEHLTKSVDKDTKVVGIAVMDPFGTSPVPIATTERHIRKERLSFKRLCLKVKELKKKNNFKVVVGGSGAWQLTFDKELREEYGIDHLVVGEADDKISGIINDIESDDAPEIIYTHTNEIKDVPYIQGPTCGGMIEAMRGCGRGCDFCSPNLRMKRDFPIERLKKEAMINVKHGNYNVLLQSDELLLYGLDNSEMRPNKDAVIDLFQELKSLPKVETVSAIHLAFSSAVAEPDCITKFSEISNLGPGKWTGIQTGLETASASLMKKHMPIKSKPFSPEEWAQVSLDGIKLLGKNYIFVINTIIIGLPGEIDDDVRETIELIKKLEGLPCIVIPLLYTDWQNLQSSLTNKKMTKLQWELDYACWRLNARAVKKWVWEGGSLFNPFTRIVASVFAQFGINRWLKLLRDTAKSQSGVILE